MTEGSIMKIRPLESIIKYFSDMIAEKRTESESEEKEFALHQKKAIYIDSLQLNIGSILGKSKKVIYENDKVNGYFVVIGDVKKDGNKKSLYPDITIMLETEDLRKIKLKVWNEYKRDLIMELPILSDDDYRAARDNICDYVSQRFKKN